jgi:hypothetical protein
VNIQPANGGEYSGGADIWSTYLNTLQFDYDQFVEEFDRIGTHVREQMAGGAPA